ncbi:MAG: ribosome biogenesis GTP-binding protein YihA/YsxC [Clostridiales bacterium]|nr:ribosome biogenesis GTP-binding protein YihA/YsxC [Clostridiales bacterium]
MSNDFAIKQATFIGSCAAGTPYPPPLPFEVAIVGKSNVGKSSLINNLCRNNKLARVSGQPGKTRLINYFCINNAFYLVDLPGYGFARASKTEKQSWGALVEGYLASGRVNHLFLLLDIRHPPTVDDAAMYRYLLYYGTPFTLIATKADKIARAHRKNQANANAKLLTGVPFALSYSSENGEGRTELVQRLGALYDDAIQIASHTI